MVSSASRWHILPWAVCMCVGLPQFPGHPHQIKELDVAPLSPHGSPVTILSTPRPTHLLYVDDNPSERLPYLDIGPSAPLYYVEKNTPELVPSYLETDRPETLSIIRGRLESHFTIKDQPGPLYIIKDLTEPLSIIRARLESHFIIKDQPGPLSLIKYPTDPTSSFTEPPESPPIITDPPVNTVSCPHSTPTTRVIQTFPIIDAQLSLLTDPPSGDSIGFASCSCNDCTHGCEFRNTPGHLIKDTTAPLYIITDPSETLIIITDPPASLYDITQIPLVQQTISPSGVCVNTPTAESDITTVESTIITSPNCPCRNCFNGCWVRNQHIP